MVTGIRGANGEEGDVFSLEGEEGDELMVGKDWVKGGGQKFSLVGEGHLMGED